MNRMPQTSRDYSGKAAPKRSTVLTGRKEISAFLGRSWKTVALWIREGAPIAKIGGRIEADSEALLEWRRKHIEMAAALSGTGSEPAQKRGGPGKSA